MRRLLMIVTMLLVPAIAGAWTLPVKVTNNTAGIQAGNAATVTFVGGTTPTANVVTAGTKYFYPTTATTAVTISLANPTMVTSVKVNGSPITPVPASFTVTKGPLSLYSVEVVYQTTTAVPKHRISLTQTSGGLTSLGINASTTTVGFTDVPEGTVVTVKAQPSTGYLFSSYSITGATISGDTFTVGTSDIAVSATYVPSPVVSSLLLSAPAMTPSGKELVVAATAVSTAPAYYLFTTTCPGGTNQTAFSTARTFTFTPSTPGVCTVTVAAAANASGTGAISETASMNVTSAVAATNYACTSCHSGSTPAVVASYNRSIHVEEGQTCQSCHSPAGCASNVNPRTVDKVTFKALTTAGPAAKGDYFCWNATCHANRLATDLPRIQASSHFAQFNGSACSSCHSTDMHDQDGSFDKCDRCHTDRPFATASASKHYSAITGASCRTCHTGTVGYGYNPTPTVVGSSMSFTRPSSASVSKHRAEMFNWATSDVCGNCHAAIRTEFRQTAHWNNNLEYGPEFTGGAVPEQMNANESWTTYENGSLTTCSIRCHFKPNLGPNPRAMNTLATLSPGKDECLACHDPHQLEASYLTCHDCHRQNNTARASNSGHGKIPAEFYGSPHWKNNFEYGPEFTNQLNITYAPQLQVPDAKVLKDGSTTDGILNANDSYQTTENGAVVTCAYRCHFRPGMGPQKDVPGVLANGKSTQTITYTDTTGKYGPVGQVYSRPGGDSCIACHDSHNLEASAQSTCYVCHSGNKHGWSVKAFEASTHFTGTYAKLDGLDKEACLGCHDAHSTEASFANVSTTTTLHAAGAATGCQKCHTPGAPYGIYDANLVMVAPHGGGAPTNGTATGGTSKTQWVTQGFTCTDCHAHNNSINAQFAESGHSKVSNDDLNAFTHYDWRLRTNDGTRSNSNCDRCHTTNGFVKFANQTSSVSGGFARIALVSGQPNATLACITCHKYLEGEGKTLPGLRTDAVPTGMTAPLSGGYKALFTASGATTTEIQFDNYKNSNICIPCHSGRTTENIVKTYYDPAFSNRTTGTTGFYQHAANIVQTFAGVGAYEYVAGNFSGLPKHHTGLGMSVNTDNGPCATCHDAHSLEVTNFASCSTQYCHPSAFGQADLDRAKANYDAAVKVLTNLVETKIGPLFVVPGTPITTERAAVRFGRFGKAPGEAATVETASKAAGAWYNWHILTNADPTAWVHNPAYARQILIDTIDFLDDGVNNGSAQSTVAKAAGTVVTDAEKAAALTMTSAQGCNGCHAATISAAPHNAGLPNGTQAAYVSSRSLCSDCHAPTAYHFSSSAQNEEFALSGHGDVFSEPWFGGTGHDWKASANCNACHTTTGFRKFVDSNFTDAAAWGIGEYGANEVASCKACHTDNADFKGSVLQTGAVTAGMGGYGTAAKANLVFEDVGESNVCIPCHASRENGASLIAANNASFTNPHYLAAAAVFYGKGGFQFYTSGVRYNTYGAAGKVGRNANWNHGKLGFGNWTTTSNATVKASGAIISSGTGGQCVACHLGPANTHSFGAAEVAKATKGTSSYTRNCYGCHTNTDPNAAAVTIEQFIEEEAEIWNRMYDFFKWQLAQSDVVYGDAYPYFTFTNGKSFATAVVGQTFNNPTTNANMTEGAAMNLKLLIAEKGAPVHNRSFGRALIADSITYLQKGAVGDRTVVYSTQNDVIKFSDYSAARPTSYPGQTGPDVSISTLKSYLTRASGGGYIRR